ncbi:MAG: hypothetical protein WA871_02285 [Candidatus Acidiferrales bacterium]
MRFYTKEECETWLSDRQRRKPDLMPGVHAEHIPYPLKPYQVFSFALWIASELTYRMPTQVFITEWGIWPSSENWHLYYKLRQTYGDNRQLGDAPGHLFLEHECEDLASFLQLSMLNGWGGYILTQADYVNAFFSHDEYIDFFAQDPGNLANIRKALGNHKSTSDSA